MAQLTTGNRTRVKKVVKGLKKAVKAHTGQHKSLQKVLGRNGTKRSSAKGKK